MPLPILREREKRVLFFLRLWQYEKRYTPSAAEIAGYFGVHRSTIVAVLSSLKKKGYIEVSLNKDWRHRTILFPTGIELPWGNEQLPDELFDYLKPENRKDGHQSPIDGKPADEMQ